MVGGSPKPVAEVFRSFDPTDTTTGDCVCLENYFNYSQGRVSRLTGRLVGPDGRPIAQGVVLGWNEHWTSSHHTITKTDGTFELLGTFYFHHWMASASEWSMVRGDCEPNAFIRADDGMPSFYLGDLVLERL